MKFTPSFYIGKYRNSLFLIKKTPLYPSLINLSDYYADNITPHTPYITTTTHLNYTSNTTDLFTYTSICTYYPHNKLLTIIFTWESKFGNADGLFLECVEYYPHHLYFINRQMQKNTPNILTIPVNDITYTYKNNDVIRFKVKYRRYISLKEQTYYIPININYIGFNDTISPKSIYKSTPLHTTYTINNQFAKIIYEPIKYETIIPQSTYSHQKETINKTILFCPLKPYYLKSNTTETISPTSPYNHTKRYINYPSLNFWSQG